MALAMTGGQPAVRIPGQTAPAVRVVEAPVVGVRIVERGLRGPEGPVADLDTILEKVDEAVGDYFVLHPQTFVYDQPTGVEDTVLDILHPLDHYPTVVVTDSAGTEWVGAVSYPAPNRVLVEYNHPHSGLRATLT